MLLKDVKTYVGKLCVSAVRVGCNKRPLSVMRAAVVGSAEWSTDTSHPRRALELSWKAMMELLGCP